MTEPIIVYSFTNILVSHTLFYINFEVDGKPFSINLDVIAERGTLVKLPICDFKSIIGGNGIVEIKVKLIHSGIFQIPITDFIKRPITNQLTKTRLILEIFEFIDCRGLKNNNCLDIIRLVTSGAVKIGNESIKYQAIPF